MTEGASDLAWYPLVNLLAGEIINGWFQSTVRKTAKKGRGRRRQAEGDLSKRLAELDAWAKQLGESSADTWALSLGPDCALMTALAKGQLDSHTREELTKRYLRAGQRGRSARVWGSILSQIRFFNKMAGRVRQRGGWSLAADLEKLVVDLENSAKG